MRVVEIKAGLVRVPLPAPVRNGTATITDRDYVIVRAVADDGSQGVACGLARGGDLVGLIDRHFAPLAVDRGVHEPTVVSRAMWDHATPFLGSDGAVARAISLVDIALWDLHAIAAGLPLADLLGAGGIQSVPVMVATGYYRHDDPARELSWLEEEYSSWADAGVSRLKVMAGAADPSFDADRIRAAALAAGGSVGVDVNGAWQTPADGWKLLRMVDEGLVDFIEEPFPAHATEALQRFRRTASTAVALGEWESELRTFQRLMGDHLLDIARFDVTAVGGVTGWLAVAGLAAAHDIPVLPHYFPQFHAPLAAAFPHVLAVEVVPPSSGAENFHQLLVDPPAVDKGRIALPNRPGFGLIWDWDRIESFTKGGI